MKKIALFISAVLMSSSAIADDSLFQPWCDAYTAQSMVSLAANRIYGSPSTLNDEQYEARSQWVNESYRMATERFADRTGQSFDQVDLDAMTNGWRQRCQLKEQIQ